jgi:hypothetical protein
VGGALDKQVGSQHRRTVRSAAVHSSPSPPIISAARVGKYRSRKYRYYAHNLCESTDALAASEKRAAIKKEPPLKGPPLKKNRH